MKKDQLMSILLDPSASDAEKDDAAICLAEFDDEEVIKVLISVANDDSSQSIIRATCGESLAEIWINLNTP